MVPSDIRQRIGPAIRQLREQQGWALADLAERTGISISHLWRLEKGGSVLSFTSLARLAQVLGVELTYFVTAEYEAQIVDAQLAHALLHTTIPVSVWPELFGVSLAARKELLALLERQGVPVHTPAPPPPPRPPQRRRPRTSG